MKRKKEKTPVIIDVAQQEAEKKELAWSEKRDRARNENAYVKARSAAEYYFARYNMLVEQVNNYAEYGATRLEKIDGVVKSKDLLLAECRRTKIEASTKYRDAWFIQQDMLHAGVTLEELDAIYLDYVGGPIVRESYDEQYRRPSSGFQPTTS